MLLVSPAYFFLGKQIFNSRVGLYASLVMCLSSFHLWYAQEARPYSLSVLLSILSAYFLYRFLTEGKIKLGFIYVLFFILGFYSNITYYHLFLLAAQLLAAVIFIRKNIYLKLFPFFCLIFLAFSLRLEFFISKFLYVKGGFWIPVPSLKSLISTLENFNLGYNVSVGLYWFSDLIVLIILVAGFLTLRQKKSGRKNFIFVTVLSFLPLALAFGFSKIFFPVYLDRGLIIFSPYYYLLLGVGIGYLGNKRLTKIILSAFLMILLISLSSYYRNLMPVGPEHHHGVILKKPFKPALRFIENNFKLGDIIMHTNSSSQEVFKFYSSNKEIAQNFLFAPKMIDSSWNRPYESGLGNVNVKELASINAKRIWVVSCDWQRGKELDKNSEAVNSEMSKLYKLDLSLEFDGLWVYRYLKLS
ncbi:MAG: glycosyltransferase family 39 protein [Candidatus Omnitrophica bacterium]|nr:glycosyltransferase family 39 protein [Candidatus Omnitrophota bacterium]